ncbi:MAG: ADP-forming succinate--CoA ligase subunit beta [Alphaproteobacteria bacterium]|nr:MAG: ADP-forming succinate--CoA ligase subunit beta [Alphaproteobacteria bacterium]
MDLHEYQAKELLERFGVLVPQGGVAETVEAAERVAHSLPGGSYAVKAQVHAGGRGRAGGVRIVDSPAAVAAAAGELLGQELVTEQTGPQGRKIRAVYVEEAIEPERNVYVAALVDTVAGKLSLLGAEEGGEDIEERAARTPDIIKTLHVELDGKTPDSAFRAFAESLKLSGASRDKAVDLFKGLTRAFQALDASLIEINPLALTAHGDLIALDVKMILDDNALFRHPDLKGLQLREEGDPVEMKAQANEINYLRLDGNIGVVVNGAGLALATNDMLADRGGRPANFMDIRTTATSLDIAAGFDLLLDNPDVKVILVNVHGGGLQRCDTIAEGIGISLKRRQRSLPIVLRFAGNNADFGRTLLNNYGISYIEADDMADAIERAVALARKEAA